MPGTVRTYTYTFVPAPEDVDLVTSHVKKVIGWACDGDTALTCEGVTGAELGLVRFQLKVRARDRWWATQLVQDVLAVIQQGLGSKTGRLLPTSEPPPPHQHRGYAYGRSRRTRTPRQPPSTDPTTAESGDLPFNADVSPPGSVT